jgi:hypothetical protein
LQIKNGLELNNKYGPQDFKFLEDIADLVIRARRALTYTYAQRFYLESKAKQVFFDHQQAILEESLEKLNKRNEEDWQLYLDTDGYGRKIYFSLLNKLEIHLGSRFIRYKEEVNNLRHVMEKYFKEVISDIEAGLPSIPDDMKIRESEVDRFGSL